MFIFFLKLIKGKLFKSSFLRQEKRKDSQYFNLAARKLNFCQTRRGTVSTRIVDMIKIKIRPVKAMLNWY
jgi:hypothetical protein